MENFFSILNIENSLLILFKPFTNRDLTIEWIHFSPKIYTPFLKKR